MKKGIVCMVMLLFFIGPAAVKADDVSELKQQLAEQNKMLQEMQQKIEKLESQQNKQDEVIQQKVTQVVNEKKADIIPDSLKWAEKIKLNGDFRYRHETVNSKSNEKEQPGKNNNRIRARLGIDVKVNEDWDLGFRLATGASDPASTNQSLDNGFAKKDVWLDLAYFNWHPKKYENRLNIYGGPESAGNVVQLPVCYRPRIVP